MNRAKAQMQIRPAAFTLIEAIVVVVVLAILIALILPAVQAARAASRRIACASSLRQIGLGLHNYLTSQNYFPGIDLRSGFPPGAAGGPSEHYFSPVARMLAQLEQVPLYNATNFAVPPVTGTFMNQTVMKVGLALLICPTDSQPSVQGFGRSNFRFSLGPSPIWAPGYNYPLSVAGPFTVHVVYAPADFRDGLSQTVGVSERLEGDWTKGPFKLGGDYYYDRTSSWPPYLNDPDQTLRVCANLPPESPVESRGGESWFLSGYHFTCYNHCAVPNLKVPDCSVGSANAPHTLGYRINQQGVFKASSYHAGGVNALLMDGSTRFFSDSVNLGVWRALATRSGGELIEP